MFRANPVSLFFPAAHPGSTSRSVLRANPVPVLPCRLSWQRQLPVSVRFANTLSIKSSDQVTLRVFSPAGVLDATPADLKGSGNTRIKGRGGSGLNACSGGKSA
jgi:hypothetical protein